MPLWLSLSLLAFTLPTAQAQQFTSLGSILGPGPSTGGGAQQCTAPPGGATCGGSGPTSQGNTSGVNLGAGNPINLTNGNKYQREVDLPALPGELGIEIVRHYNSSQRFVVGQLGMGWRLSYETDLYVVGQTVQILQADGARLIFNIDPRNPTLCAGANPAQGWVQILSPAPGGARNPVSYIWHWSHGEHAGRQLRFDPRGKLVQIASASGAVLSITRGPKGELLSVTDPQGRSLRFNHGGPGRVREAEQAAQQAQRAQATQSGNLVGHASGLAVFTGVQSIDTPLGRFTYTHGVPASVSSSASSATAQALARAQAANLTQVSLPTHVDTSQSAHAMANRPLSSSSVKRLYHYEDTRHPQALTGVSVLGSGSDAQVVSQRLSTFGYNERAQAVLSVRGEPARLVPGTGVEQVQVQILRPALPGLGSPPGQTLLTNSLGQQTLYTHRIVGGEYRLVQAVGAGCSQCGPVNLRWSYDSLGRLIEQTTLSPVVVQDGQPQGTPQPLASTRHTLDAQGRTQRIEQVAYVGGKAQTPQLVERHEYLDPRWPDKPTRIARPSVVSGQEQQITLSYNEAGQVTQMLQTGFSPLDASGQPARTPAQASRMERATTYTYSRINGRSLLTQVDGPLPNGPSASPADSDITQLRWDDKGSFLTTVHAPGGLRNDITHSASTGLVERVVNDAGFATTLAYNPQLQAIRISSQGPGWAQAQVQSFQYDALGHRVQSFLGDAITTQNGEDSTEARPTERQAFDAQGRLLWQANALGLLHTFQYDTEGQLLQSRLLSNSMAKTQRLTYDELGRPTSMTDNAGRVRSLRYGADGLPLAFVDALGREATAPSAALAQDARTRNAAIRPMNLSDDFGRNVFTRSPDSGLSLRQFDAADRLLAMTDALGNTARYGYDAQGRILKQTITDAKTQAQTLTIWRYNTRHLLEVIHPTQRERFEVDARGLRTARIVTRPTTGRAQGELVAVTRYEHDERGQLIATTLPDGSRLVYERNGQQQVVALKRQTIQTPWLRWLGRDQVLAQDFERDLVGLRSYTSGNGVQARFQRSASGDLARVVYRHANPRPALQARSKPATLLGRSTQETIERLLGVAPAHAQAVPLAPAGSSAPASAASAADLPGALGMPTDPQALIDHRYLWSAEGHLLLNQQRAGSAAEHTQHSHAYNARGQLVASVRASRGSSEQETAQETAQEQAVWRYAYDASQRRVLSQQGVASQSDITSATQRSAFEPGSHRLNPNAATTAYNANGQPVRLGSREYVWDALGRLVEVREETNPLARYGYDHRGLRTSKTVGANTRHALYDESRQPLAELDAQGRITRQYVWLADMPLAVIDTPQGAALAAAAPGLWQIWADVRSAINSWLGSEEGLAWLHTNHLGAPEAATNAQGQLVWRATYAPFGAAQLQASAGFMLNLRLPGQVWDEETGLHYNRQRYYDPETGQYLTPDPLGTPDGPNPYAYVAFNPLSNIDPDGLVLFAFDGTGNDRESRTNVLHLAQYYTDEDEYFGSTASGAYDWQRFYIEGVGTRGGLGDNTITGGALALQMRGRIDEQLLRLDQYVIDRYRFYRDRDFRGAPISRDNPLEYDIDITGFSRGAASARDFANQIVNRENAGYFRGLRDIDGDCVRVNIRFIGLFDTVQSFTVGNFNLGLPEAVGFVAHAVARNEYRSQFPLESIEAGTSNTGFASNRIERAFVGAHSDVGGGYNGVGARQGDGGDLSDVALNWMVQQAQAQGVQFNELPDELLVVSNPIVHDETTAGVFYNPSPTRDREVRYADGSRANGRQAPLEGMTHTEAVGLIQYAPCASCPVNQVGRVDMPAYLQWLREHAADYGNINVRP